MADFDKYKNFINMYKSKQDSMVSDFKSYRYFLTDQKPEGYVRLLPANSEMPFIPFAVHKIEQDGKYKYFLCPKKTAFLMNEDPEQHECPICDNIIKLNNKDIEKQFAPKNRVLFYVLDILALSEGDKEPKAFSLASNMAMELVDLINYNFELLDIEKGKVVKILMIRDNRGFPRYTFEITNKAVDLNTIADLEMTIENNIITYPFGLEDVYPVATTEDVLTIPELNPAETILNKEAVPDKEDNIAGFNEWLNGI